MKKAYVKPIAYVEMFTPNQYAGNCVPGVSEKDLDPTSVDCWFHQNDFWTYRIETYNFAQGSCKSIKKDYGSGCSNNGNTLTLLTNKCQVNFSNDSTYGTGDGVSVNYVKISTILFGIETEKGAMYSWPNGQGGSHYAMAKDVIPGQTYVDGKPYYFNS